jgi:hypothetical protein
VSRWVIIFAAVMIAASGGIYFWSANTVEEKASTAGVRSLAVDNLTYRDYVQSGRASSPTLYFQMNPNWDTVPKEKKTEVMQKMVATAAEVDCTQVSLIAANGKNAGYAAANRVDIPLH